MEIFHELSQNFIKGFKWKSYGVCKNFNISRMRACENHIYGWDSWLMWPKGSQKCKLCNLGMKFWTWSLGKEWDMLGQQTLANVFILSKCINLHVMKQLCVVILGFNKNNPKNALTSLIRYNYIWHSFFSYG